MLTPFPNESLSFSVLIPNEFNGVAHTRVPGNQHWLIEQSLSLRMVEFLQLLLKTEYKATITVQFLLSVAKRAVFIPSGKGHPVRFQQKR